MTTCPTPIPEPGAEVKTMTILDLSLILANLPPNTALRCLELEVITPDLDVTTSATLADAVPGLGWSLIKRSNKTRMRLVLNYYAEGEL